VCSLKLSIALQRPPLHHSPPLKVYKVVSARWRHALACKSLLCCLKYLCRGQGGGSKGGWEVSQDEDAFACPPSLNTLSLSGLEMVCFHSCYTDKKSSSVSLRYSMVKYVITYAYLKTTTSKCHCKFFLVILYNNIFSDSKFQMSYYTLKKFVTTYSQKL